MLYITSVQPTGLFSYGSSELIPLNVEKFINLIGINEDKNGDSNGSGKTSLFNAICRILYGEDPTGVKSSEVPNILWGQGYAGRVEFTSWGNIPYRVTDCRDWKEGNYHPSDNDNKTVYKGTKLYFDRWDGNGWVDCRGDSNASTRAAVIKALGMSYNRFLSISYMSHRVGSVFLRGSSKERMDVLSGVSGVEEWDKKLEEFKEKRRPLNKEIADKSQSLSYKEGQLSMMNQQLSSLLGTDWNSVIDQTMSDLGSIGIDILSAQKIIESIQVRYKLVYDEAQYLDPEAAKLTKERNTLVQQREVFRVQSETPLGETVEMQAIRAETNKLQGAKQALSGEVDLASMEKCPTCGHKITKAQKDRIAKKLNELETALNHQNSQFVKASRELTESDSERKTGLLGKIVNLGKQIDQIDKKLTQFQGQRTEATQKLHQVTEELTKANFELNKLNQRKSHLDQQLLDYQSKKFEAEKAKNAIVEMTNEINSLKIEVQNLTGKVIIYNWFVDNIPYIKLHKLSLTMKLLSDRANKYFEDMGDSVRISISPFSEKKSKKGADLKDLLKGEINVEIMDGQKNIDPRLYSDGEIAKISNALIRALHDVATSYGHGCNLLMLDEIFSFVDTNNSQKLAESFYSNLHKGLTLITDNSGIVQNLMNFDETWVARKKNGITTLERNNG